MNIRKKAFFICSIILSFCPPVCSSVNEDGESVFTLYDAVSLAVQHNYDIRKQQQALIIANARYLQAKGELDLSIGASGQFTYAQNPVDERDPNYLYGYSFTTPDSVYGIFSNNSLTRQVGGSLFIQKLFSFGLQSKLSYTLQRTNNRSAYDYGNTFSSNTYKRYKDEHGRNLGEVSLELNLPLFKSFNASITALQIAQAKDYLDQMTYNLRDTISQTIIKTTRSFWNYYMAYRNLSQLHMLQKRIDARNDNIDKLVKAGVRMKNDILAMQVSSISNRQKIDAAQVQYIQTKMELANMIGLTDAEGIDTPSDMLPIIHLEEIPDFPAPEDITLDLLEYVEQNRADFIMLQDQMNSALRKIKIAEVNGRPDATLGFKIGVNGTTYSDDVSEVLSAGFWNIRGLNLNGSLGVTIKPFSRSKKGSVQEAEAEYESLNVEFEKNKNMLYLQLRNTVEKLNLYRASLLGAEGIFALQKELYENEEKRFAAGLITVDNLIEQDQKYVQATSERYQTLGNYLETLLEYKYNTASLLYVDADSVFSVDDAAKVDEMASAEITKEED